MSKKNRIATQTISQSTASEAAVRNGNGLPVPTDAELDAGINTAGTTVEDVAAVLGTSSNGHNFKAADDVAKKGPYATEAEARLPENHYRNAGKVAWELYEVEVASSTLDVLDLGWINSDGKCFTWACNADLAIAFVARQAGWEASKAGAKTVAPSVKAKLESALDAVAEERRKNEILLAKLKAAGIEL